ncbi:hypothetical protein ANN_08751 [Periplaneta americana]|uniref:DUF659 domain-containing protein n=1 Tax=Periplaneta americana TaxID=6978 RepID=A0ABQ8T298_PERAM|nr:hypothetical protein ANN_08751 [Periplaneta americana]
MQPAPSETTLRKYLAKYSEDGFQETKSKCEGNSVYLVVDETTDIKNRKVVNVLVATLGVVNEKPRLTVHHISFLLAGVALQLLCSTCWTHVLHLCAEDIRFPLKIAVEFIAAVKAALAKTPARRERLLDFLKEAGTFALPPVPIITRWGTWLKAGKYHCINFNALD